MKNPRRAEAFRAASLRTDRMLARLHRSLGPRTLTVTIRFDRVTVDGCYRVLAGTASGAPYLMAEVIPVHQYRCRATTLGKRAGPCHCGAQLLYGTWLTKERRKKRATNAPGA